MLRSAVQTLLGAMLLSQAAMAQMDRKGPVAVFSDPGGGPSPEYRWLPPKMAYPLKLSPDLYVNDEYPSLARDSSGRVWAAWVSCRPRTAKPLHDDANLENWLWPDDGEDHIVIRSYDGKDWSDEETVSSRPGVNYKPVVLAEGNGVRVLWTARRGGRWQVLERTWQQGKWGAETAVPHTDGVTEVNAIVLSGGGILAVGQKPNPPRLELHTFLYANGQWDARGRLDEGIGRCHRTSLLALPGGHWLAAWDEERNGNYDIRSRGSAMPAQAVASSEFWETSPSLARTPDSRLWIVWEQKEPLGGRFNYSGRSIYGKFHEGGQWKWAPSPYGAADPGRLTAHNRFWTTQGISEEKHPRLHARANGDLWLSWLGGGRMDSTSLSSRVLRRNGWSEPVLVFYDNLPYTAFQTASARRGLDMRAFGRGPYQTPLANQFSYLMDDASGMLWLAYEVPRRRHATDVQWEMTIQQRPVGYGADVYTHAVDIDERELRLPRVVETGAADPHKPVPYRRPAPHTITVGGQQYHLIFGDVHGHTEPDGIGTLDMYYAHGLMVSGMDYVALTNHDFTPDFLTSSEWAITQMLAAVYNRLPGRIAFSGWEWTTAPVDAQGGHRAIYFLRDDAPLYRSTTVESSNITKLYDRMRGQEAIFQPHHKGWEGYDPQLNPVYEVTSAWREPREEGKELKPSGKIQSVWEALERGYRLGFVGAGDSHWLGPGEDYGITGAYVKEISREGVFEAVRARRVFASTGARMMLDFRANGVLMGGETRANGPARLQVSVTGGALLDRVEIIRDGKQIYTTQAQTNEHRIEYVDVEPPSRSISYYYVRVTQKDGMQAWSSPVWIQR